MRRTSLSLHEQETIINFNRGDATAHVFTYDKTWQKHLEGRLRLKPVMVNGHGGRGYLIDKKRIPVPRAPRRLTDRQRKELGQRLARGRARQRVSAPQLM